MKLKCKPLLVSCRVILHNSTNAKTTQIIKYKKLLFQMQILSIYSNLSSQRQKKQEKICFSFFLSCFCLEAPIHGNTLQLLFLGRIHI